MHRTKTTIAIKKYTLFIVVKRGVHNLRTSAWFSPQESHAIAMTYKNVLRWLGVRCWGMVCGCTVSVLSLKLLWNIFDLCSSDMYTLVVLKVITQALYHHKRSLSHAKLCTFFYLMVTSKLNNSMN